jgi:hypothetical protein
MDKPPIGLRPRHIAEAARLTEILEAMDRYEKAGYEIPTEWFLEYKELSTKVLFRKR